MFSSTTVANIPDNGCDRWPNEFDIIIVDAVILENIPWVSIVMIFLLFYTCIQYDEPPSYQYINIKYITSFNS